MIVEIAIGVIVAALILHNWRAFLELIVAGVIVLLAIAAIVVLWLGYQAMPELFAGAIALILISTLAWAGYQLIVTPRPRPGFTDKAIRKAIEANES